MTRRLLAFLAATLFGLGAASAQPSGRKVYTHNARGQVTSIADPAHPESDATYSYDDNGNRTGKLQAGVVTTYQWDARDRLVGVLRDGQPLARYRYDYAGRRVEKETLVAPLILVRFQYSGPLLESESNVIGNTIARYQRAVDGRLISYRRLGTIRNVATDALGTPVALLSEQGSAIARYSYDSWGNRKQLDGTEEIPIGHSGYYFDKETGLYYAGARYYDPAIGAFISEDPVDGDVERPVTQNRYVAFNANPTVYTDPDGRCGIAAMDASECINNVAVANGWSAQRTLEEQQIQHEAEARSAPGKLFNTLTFVIAGPIIRGSLAAGLGAYSATGSVRWGLAVAATRASPLAEPAAQIAANVPGPSMLPTSPLATSAARAEAALAQEARAASLVDDVSSVPVNLPRDQAVTIAEGMGPSQIPGASLATKTGETASTSTGKMVHARLAAERRLSGEFDLVNQPLVDAAGNPIEVTRRVNLKTGDPLPESGYQVARPDAVRFKGDVILDDKPLGRPIAKDQQEIIRFINAYAESQGRQPRTIGIQRYDPETGTPVVTELYSPEHFQTWNKQ